MRVALLLLLLLLVVLLLLTVLPQMDAGRLRVGGGRYKAVGAMELVVGGISLALVLGVGDCSAAAPQGFSVFQMYLTPALLFLVGGSYIRSGTSIIARPALFASRSVRRALLTPQVNPGSLYR